MQVVKILLAKDTCFINIFCLSNQFTFYILFLDYLLCHDDLYSDRLIAFVLYLSENWTKSDGGSLHFFDYNEGKCSVLKGPVIGSTACNCTFCKYCLLICY